MVLEAVAVVAVVAVAPHAEDPHVPSHQEVAVVTIGHHCRLRQKVEIEVEVL